MIRIVLLGRTGNHLFQYALGRVLALRHGVPLVLDGSWFNRDGWKEVSHWLDLPLQAQVVRRWPLAARGLRKVTGRHYWQFLPVPWLQEREADQSFDPRILDAPDDCVLFGYFQSPRYFASIEGPLRDELWQLLELGAPIDAADRERMTDASSVAVHVRRGDYLLHDAFHVCTRDYYERAIDQLRTELANPRFYIFSDDPAWCREHFRGPDMTVVASGHAGSNPLHDLHLMSLARHHIIANSSYSWWAAWLGNHAGQRVLMPDRWYASGIHAPIAEKALPHWTTVATGLKV